MAAAARTNDTSARILDTAERLMQMRGYNGISYADIASGLRLTNASLHYHFPTKADLGRRLMRRYTEAFLAVLAEIDAGAYSSPEKLKRYVDIYAGVLANNRMCLCGILAAEYATLPKAVKIEVTSFFDATETWLAATLEHGRKDGSLKFAGQALEAARLLVAALEGAMMLARSYGDTKRFDAAAGRLLAALAA
jgi:TetR/AcrR family transcriptional repressor of nem operon